LNINLLFEFKIIPKLFLLLFISCYLFYYYCAGFPTGTASFPRLVIQ
jgi:hypothetical protein